MGSQLRFSSTKHGEGTRDFFLAWLAPLPTVESRSQSMAANYLDQYAGESDELWCAGTNLIAQRNIRCPLTASTRTTTWQRTPTRQQPSKRPEQAARPLPRRRNSAKPQPCGQRAAWWKSGTSSLGRRPPQNSRRSSGSRIARAL